MIIPWKVLTTPLRKTNPFGSGFDSYASVQLFPRRNRGEDKYNVAE